MNQLNNTENNQNEKFLSEAIKALQEFSVSPENIIAASDFLDMNNKLNVELLKKIKPEKSEVNFRSVSWDASFFGLSMLIDTEFGKSPFDFDKASRYMLLLEALYGEKMAVLAGANNYGVSIKFGEAVERMVKLFSVRYTKKEALGRAAAVYIFNKTEINDDVFEYFKNSVDPEILFDAAMTYYDMPWGSKYTLFCIAFSLLNEELLKEQKLSCLCKKALVQISEHRRNENGMRFPCCLAAAKFSDALRFEAEELAESNSIELAAEIFRCFNKSYIEENIEFIFEIFGVKGDRNLKKLIQTSEMYAFYRKYKYPNAEHYVEDRAACFLKELSKAVPEKVIKAMSEKIYAPMPQWFRDYGSYGEIYVPVFLPFMYKIINETNSEAIKKSGFVYANSLMAAVVDMLVPDRLPLDFDLKFHVRRYLSGKISFSAFTPFIEDLQDTELFGEQSGWQKFSAMLIKECIDCKPDFGNRYYIFCGAVRPEKLVEFIQNLTDSESERFDILENIVRAIESKRNTKRYIMNAVKGILLHLKKYYMSRSELDGYIKAIAKSLRGSAEDYASLHRGDILFRKLYVEFLAMNNDGGKYKKELLTMCADPSKEVKAIAIEAVAEDRSSESEVLEILKSKKSARREAGLRIIEAFGAENYEEALREFIENEKSEKIADYARKLLSSSGIPTTNNLSAEELSEFIHRGDKGKKLQTYFETPNTEVHFKDGTKADDRYLQAIMLCYADMASPGVNKNANKLAEELDKTELEVFAGDVFSKWLDNGAEAKERWLLYFVSIHGGLNAVKLLQEYIKTWSESLRGALAAEAVSALALNGSREALIAVDGIAYKFKHKQVKTAASKAMSSAAENLGITSEELSDRIVPDLGFDENSERIFDYGARKFKVRLNSARKLEIYNEVGEELKNLPRVCVDDDEKIAKAAGTEFKQLRKQLKNVVSTQKLRIEAALISDRRWTLEDWKELFIKNPVMRSFAMGLVWTAYEDGKAVETFRCTEKGELFCSNGAGYNISDRCTIGLMHPIDLDGRKLSAWRKSFNSLKIVQPIQQLERSTFKIKESENGKREILRFDGNRISAYALLSKLTRLGWLKGEVLDEGIFYTFYRCDVSGMKELPDGKTESMGFGAKLYFSGMYVGGQYDEVKLESLRFYTADKADGKYSYSSAENLKALPLEEVPTRYFSEIVRQLETII